MDDLTTILQYNINSTYYIIWMIWQLFYSITLTVQFLLVICKLYEYCQPVNTGKGQSTDQISGPHNMKTGPRLEILFLSLSPHCL